MLKVVADGSGYGLCLLLRVSLRGMAMVMPMCKGYEYGLLLWLRGYGYGYV